MNKFYHVFYSTVLLLTVPGLQLHARQSVPLETLPLLKHNTPEIINDGIKSNKVYEHTFNKAVSNKQAAQASKVNAEREKQPATQTIARKQAAQANKVNAEREKQPVTQTIVHKQIAQASKVNAEREKQPGTQTIVHKQAAQASKVNAKREKRPATQIIRQEFIPGHWPAIPINTDTLSEVIDTENNDKLTMQDEARQGDASLSHKKHFIQSTPVGMTSPLQNDVVHTPWQIKRTHDGNGHVIYQWRDDDGNMQSMSEREYKRRISLFFLALLEFLYPEIFGFPLPPGGGWHYWQYTRKAARKRKHSSVRQRPEAPLLLEHTTGGDLSSEQVEPTAKLVATNTQQINNLSSGAGQVTSTAKWQNKIGKKRKRSSVEITSDSSRPSKKQKKLPSKRSEKRHLDGLPDNGAPDVTKELAMLKDSLGDSWKHTFADKATPLFITLNCKGIKIKLTFYALLTKVPEVVWDSFCVNGATLFSHTQDAIKDTGFLTSMLNKNTGYIKDFASRKDTELIYFAQLDYLKNFSSMMSGKGLPKEDAVRKILAWDCWKNKDGWFDRELFRAFSSMFNGKGLPKEDEVKRILAWDCWQQEDGQFDRELFRAFSSMMSSKGLPKEDAVRNILAWDCWKNKDGQFDLELFRAFSSMMSGKGLPKEDAVRKILAWDCWEDKDGRFDRELFRAFSSMFNGKGLPEEGAVRKILAWDFWKNKDGRFDLELFRAFSSMMSSKGLPEEDTVRKILAWDCWKNKDGRFDRELFRAFSSMFHCKGLPKEDAVRKILAWDFWKNKDGRFDRELFRAFSSMMSGKGLPKKDAVRKILAWDCWKNKDGRFDRELFRAFSSMMNKKGLPEEGAVRKILAWDCWKNKDGQFDRELFRAFSSMMSSKGLPKEDAVRKILAWDCWKKKDGEFDRELFRAFSSMFNGKGLPEEGAVRKILAWDCWKNKDGQFDRELFRAFSSMMSSKGLPEEDAVRKILAWDCWKNKDGQFDSELFRAFSSMMSSKGLPKEDAVRKILAWDCWKNKDGQFDLELFRAFSSMMSGKGLPKEEAVNTLLTWMTHDGIIEKTILKLMARLFCGAFSVTRQASGPPDIEDLQSYEKKLKSYLELEDDEEEISVQLIKQLTLFLASKDNTWHLSWDNFESVYPEIANHCPENETLAGLLRFLVSNGGAGVNDFLAMNVQQRESMLSLCSLYASPALIKKAITDIPESDWKRYVFFNKNLKKTLDIRQWEILKAQLNTLDSILKNDRQKRAFVDIIWRFDSDSRETFFKPESVKAILDVLVATQTLNQLASELPSDTLKAIFSACISFKAATGDEAALLTLFDALLWVQQPLYGHDPLPDHFLSKIDPINEHSVLIKKTPEIPSNEVLLQYLITAFMDELSQMVYSVDGKELKIEECGGETTYTFPKPVLTIRNNGIRINNWSQQQLMEFFKITEFPEQFYRDKLWLDNANAGPIYWQRRMARIEQRKQAGGDTDDNTRFKPLGLGVLDCVLKSGKPINRITWQSFDYQKERLKQPMLEKLSAIIDNANDPNIPQTLKKYLTDWKHDVSASSSTAPVMPNPVIPKDAPPVLFELEGIRQEILAHLWVALSQTPLFGENELSLLEDYQSLMTLRQLMEVIQKSEGIQGDRRDGWIKFFREKIKGLLKRNPLLLEVDDDVYEFLNALDEE